MKHFQPRSHALGPHALSGKLFFQMPGGAAISCTCIADPYASIISAMWEKETRAIGVDFEAFRARLIEAIGAAGGQKAWAKAHNLSETYVGEILRRRREPGETICAALGLRRQVAYLPIDKPQTEFGGASDGAPSVALSMAEGAPSGRR